MQGYSQSQGKWIDIPDSQVSQYTGGSTSGGNGVTSVGGMDNTGDTSRQIDPNVMSKLFGMQALRTPKETTNLAGIFKLLNPDQTPAMKLRHDSLQTALSSLDSAQTNLASAGGAKGPIAGFLSKIPLIGQFTDPQGTAYNQTKIELATQLAKAITGGSKTNQLVIDQFLHSLPDVSEDPKFTTAKMDKLRSELMTQAKSFNFQDLLDQYPQNSTSTSGGASSKTVTMKSPDGKLYTVDPAEVATAQQNGWVTQ